MVAHAQAFILCGLQNADCLNKLFFFICNYSGDVLLKYTSLSLVCPFL